MLDDSSEMIFYCWLNNFVIDNYLSCLCLRSIEHQLLKSDEFVWHNITLQNLLKFINFAISIFKTKSKLKLNLEKHILLFENSGNNHWILCIDNLKIGVVEMYDSIKGNEAIKTIALTEDQSWRRIQSIARRGKALQTDPRQSPEVQIDYFAAMSAWTRNFQWAYTCSFEKSH